MAAALDLDGPALAPPDGVTPNFDRVENQNELAIFVLTLCAVVATLCLFLRAYARAWLLRKVGLEEALIVAAYGCFWGTLYPSYAMIETCGYFVHQWNVRLGNMIPTTYWILVFGVCYSVVLPLLKIAILLEWCRMFVPRGNRTKSYFYWGCVGLITLQIVTGVGIVIALNLQCIPHAAIYDFTVAGQCFPLYNIQVTSASIQLFSDVAIFLLPQRVIWELKMSWQKRLGVSIVFGLGLLACISAAFRLAVTVAFGNAADAIFALGPLVFWATAEMTCGFFIICVPSIPKILKDTGVLRKIKKGLSMKTTTKESKALDRYGGSTHGKGTANTSNTYYKLDEDGVPMENIKATESTERLNDGKLGSNIVRTTRITVTQDSRSDPEANYPPPDTWGK